MFQGRLNWGKVLCVVSEVLATICNTCITAQTVAVRVCGTLRHFMKSRGFELSFINTQFTEVYFSSCCISTEARHTLASLGKGCHIGKT